MTWAKSSYCDGASACVEIWRRSSRCESGDCVEVAWHKSTHSTSQECVEVGHTAGAVGLRDSKNPDGPELWFTPEEWDAFVSGVKAGEFDDMG